MQNKNFKLNKNQFNTLENIFFSYLQNNPEDNKALKLSQDLIEQALDKNQEPLTYDMLMQWDKNDLAEFILNN